MKDKALRLALEALEYASTGNRRPEIIGPAITAIKQALQQPEPEPVAYQDTAEKSRLETVPAKGTLLHPSPPKHEPEPVECMCGICKLGKREWQGLSWEEIDECFKITPDQYLPAQIYKRIEAKLKEKNHD